MNGLIKKCPVCKGEDIKYVQYAYGKFDAIKCKKCDIILMSETQEKDAASKLIEKWNRMVQDGQ